MPRPLPSRSRDRLAAAFSPVDGAALGAFRVAWGLLVLLETRWLWQHLSDLHSPDVLHFHYRGFSWIRHFPAAWMTEVEVALMMLASFFVTVGLAFRPAALVFFLGYTHLFFSEAAAYNNHFYLIVLVSGLLIFTRADASLSLRQWLRRRRDRPESGVPRWNYLALQAQVVIVYVYGGIAKIGHDWLVEMQPIRYWLHHGDHIPAPLASLARQDWFTPVAAWGGLFIDLVCPFLLFSRRTRLPAMAILVSFHFLNGQLFRIGWFPLIGIALLLVFVPPSWFGRKAAPPADTIGFPGHGDPDGAAANPTSSGARISVPILVLLGAYFAFQLLFPLRWHLWSPAHPSWTGVGHRFAWRMMLREKIATLEFGFSDPRVDRWMRRHPHLLPRVSQTAAIRLQESPLLVRQYVPALRACLAEHGMGDTEIYAHMTCSLNGRPFRPIIDPNVDLARAKMPAFGVPDWILPMPSDLPLDYDRLLPLNDANVRGWEAIRHYLERHPGPGADHLGPRPEPEPRPRSQPSRSTPLSP